LFKVRIIQIIIYYIWLEPNYSFEDVVASSLKVSGIWFMIYQQNVIGWGIRKQCQDAHLDHLELGAHPADHLQHDPGAGLLEHGDGAAVGDAL